MVKNSVAGRFIKSRTNAVTVAPRLQLNRRGQRVVNWRDIGTTGPARPGQARQLLCSRQWSGWAPPLQFALDAAAVAAAVAVDIGAPARLGCAVEIAVAVGSHPIPVPAYLSVPGIYGEREQRTDGRTGGRGLA